MSLNCRIKVRILHGDPIARAGLTEALRRYTGLEIDSPPPERAASTVISLCEVPSSHVVVADYAHGVEIATHSLRESHGPRKPKVIILAAIDREWEIKNALEQGAHGYMLMGCALDDLVAAIRAVHRGDRHLAPAIAARLAESVSVDPLTAREEDVLRLVISGLCNKAIGRHLGIAVGTVKSHLKSTFAKLNVQSRTQAVAAVERRGLLPNLRVRSHETGSVGNAPANTRHAPGAHAARAAVGA